MTFYRIVVKRKTGERARDEFIHLTQNPNQYILVMEHLPDWIVIRGAEVHVTGRDNTMEILVMPTTAMESLSKKKEEVNPNDA